MLVIPVRHRQTAKKSSNTLPEFNDFTTGFYDYLLVRLSVQFECKVEDGMGHLVVIEIWRYPYLNATAT
jgi:hypothetical protein